MTPELLAALVSVLFADVSPVGSCAGDVTGDRAVKAEDVSVLLANFGAVDASPPRGDLNDDGCVNGLDLVILLATFSCREWETNGFELPGPPADAIPMELEPWCPANFGKG